ncbi:MAG: type IV pilus modification protein PilV [Aquimonas sp.]|nr:type IV pilus modification protein PilV [Aquimonas sp.]
MVIGAKVRTQHRQNGATMIEVMVAVLVLSIGLLGMASLLGVSLRNAQSADFRSQAANLAYDFIDTARLYPNNLNVFATGAWSSPDCVVGTPAYAGSCANSSNAINCDLRRVPERVCQMLPSGRTRMVVTAPLGPANRLQVRVDVCWNDDRSETAATTADCSSRSETLFSVNAEI